MDADSAVDAAQRKARRRAEQILANECHPMPCPECGCYQDDMVGLLRKPKGLVLRVSGVFLFIISVIAAYGARFFDESTPPFPQSALATPWIFGTLGTLGVIALGYARKFAFDPNADALSRVGRSASPIDGPFRLAEFEERTQSR
jgi:hypothetical protein